MEKTQILPIVSVIALLLQSVFHIQMTDALANDITNFVLVSFSIYGIIKDHHKLTPNKNPNQLP